MGASVPIAGFIGRTYPYRLLNESQDFLSLTKKSPPVAHERRFLKFIITSKLFHSDVPIIALKLL